MRVGALFGPFRMWAGARLHGRVLGVGKKCPPNGIWRTLKAFARAPALGEDGLLTRGAERKAEP